MTPAKILAVAGLTSAIVSTVGGFLDVPHALGVAGAIMLAGNIGALIRRERPTEPSRPHARGYTTTHVLAALVVVGFVATIACAAAGHVLSRIDRAQATAKAADVRADRCAADLARLTAKSAELRRVVDVHIAIDDDRCPCLCVGEVAR